MQTPPSRRKRWLYRLGLASLALCALLVMAWFAAGEHLIAAVISRRYLPFDDQNGMVVTACSVDPPAGADVELRIAPKRAVRMLNAALETSVPSWLIRARLAIDAVNNDPAYGAMPLQLRIERDADPPLLTARLRADGVNALLKRDATHAVDVVQGMSIVYTAILAPGSTFADDGGITNTEDGPERRFRFHLRGGIDLTINNEHGMIPVRDLIGTVTILFARGRDGYHPRIHVGIDSLDADLQPPAPDAPKTMLGFVNGLGADQLKSILETALNTDMSEESEQEMVLPPWFPVDIRIDAATL